MKLKFIVVLALSLFILSCSSYSSRDIASQNFQEQGDADENQTKKPMKQNRYDFIDKR